VSRRRPGRKDRRRWRDEGSKLRCDSEREARCLLRGWDTTDGHSCVKSTEVNHFVLLKLEQLGRSNFGGDYCHPHENVDLLFRDLKEHTENEFGNLLESLRFLSG
jgi:hypothetical protein